MLTPSRELILGFAVVYIVPLLRLLTLPLSVGGPVGRFVNRWCGRWEMSIGWFRDSFGVAFLLFLGGFGLCRDGEASFYFAGPLLSMLVLLWKREAMDHLITFLHNHPHVHPQEFFDLVAASRGGLRFRLPKKPSRLLNPLSIDFRNVHGRDHIHWTLFAGLASTFFLARLVIRAHQKHHDSYMARVGHAVSFVWGARMIQLARAAVVIEGDIIDPKLHPHRLYLFNHASFLDFAIAPLCFAAEGDPQSYARFLAAKDHFIDNLFVNRILGMGRAIEALGMITVERRHSTKSKARAVISQAVKVMVDDGAPVVIFPQGTRTKPTVSLNGERLGSAYYVSRKRVQLEKEGGHLKKGAAYLGIDAVLELAHEKKCASVSLIPIGLVGTGVVCPPGSFRLKQGVVIKARIGEPIMVTSDVSVETLHQKIDDALRSLLKVHAELERRFFEDVRKMLDPLKIEEIAVAMRSWRNDDPIMFVLLDYIYACQPKHWRPLLGELVQLLLTCAPREQLVTFKYKVVEALFR